MLAVIIFGPYRTSSREYLPPQGSGSSKAVGWDVCLCVSFQVPFWDLSDVYYLWNQPQRHKNSGSNSQLIDSSIASLIAVTLLLLYLCVNGIQVRPPFSGISPADLETLGTSAIVLRPYVSKIPVVQFYLTDPLLLMSSTGFTGLMSDVFKSEVDLACVGFVLPLNHLGTMERLASWSCILLVILTSHGVASAPLSNLGYGRIFL